MIFAMFLHFLHLFLIQYSCVDPPLPATHGDEWGKLPPTTVIQLKGEDQDKDNSRINLWHVRVNRRGRHGRRKMREAQGKKDS